MQTFLDGHRLGKQRVEALQVLRALTVPGYGWRHHPATKMWTGYLARYGIEICTAWTAGGRGDTVAGTLVTEDGRVPRDQAALTAAGELPPWFRREDVHRSHRSSPLRKDSAFYRPVSDRLP